MIFAKQGVVEWSGANYSPLAFVPNVPYQDYEDEVIHFSRLLAPSFKKIYDDIWTNTTEYADHANVTRLAGAQLRDRGRRFAAELPAR